jgi:2-aminoethylphosphonate-pyruvate transaminase
MTRDWGSRDPAFVALIERVRSAVTRIVADEGYTTVPMQGSGTFAVEAMLGTLIPRNGHLVVMVNGAYGRRMVSLAERMGRTVTAIEHAESEPVDPNRLDAVLNDLPDVTHVAVVHCETTTGILNPVAAVSTVCVQHGKSLLIDAMSAFGAIPLRASEVSFDAVAASANKCLEGVPGIGFVVVREDVIQASSGNAHSMSLDLYDQWHRLDRDGQFRFTPPTHVLAALDAALAQHAVEGGTEGRGRRYDDNRIRLVGGLRALGLSTFLTDEKQAPIIITVEAPDNPNWDFHTFYDALTKRGFAIYPGKLTQAETFRVGCIGQVFPADIDRFLVAAAEILADMGI